MPTELRLVKVAVPVPLRRLFDYQYNAQQTPVIGGRVLVPFGSQKLVGYVLGFTDQTEIATHKIKHISKVIDSQVLIDKELFGFITWSAQYYQHPIGEVFSACLPGLVTKGEPAELEAERFWEITAHGREAEPKSNAVKQNAILKLAQVHNGLITLETLKLNQFAPADLRSLLNKGWLKEAVKSLKEHYVKPSIKPSEIEPNKEQHQALAQIYTKKTSFQPFLLDGVTSSGKTEVYLRSIAQQVESDKQVLVLVPEIGLTPQTVERFKQRFNANIAMLHSGMTDKQRLNEWIKAKQGLTSIVIGTRSALFTPFKNLGLIVIDEEHDLSFKQQDGFRYSARDLALVRANNLNIPIIMGSATPSMESQYNVEAGRFERLTLARRAGNAKPPHSKIFDVRQRPLQEGISKPLKEHIESHLAKDQQCLIFLNRRGYAPSILCHDCGWLAECNRCDRNMTYHQQLKRLHCHHCDRQVFLPKQCPNCQSSELLPIGLGTERLQEVLTKLFPSKKVIRVDRDSTRRKNSMQTIVRQIKNGEADIIVGTQMLAKGHHFPNLTLVAVVDIDGCLFSADYRATERTAQLLTQVAGRAGRGDAKGEIVIQSHHPDHPLLLNLFTQNYQQLSEQMLAERKAANLPPYSAQVLIRAQANQLEKPMAFLSDMANILNQYSNLSVFGPYPAPMIKRAGKMRAQLLLQADDKKTIQKILNAALPIIEQQQSAKTVRWSIDVDPQEVF
ncbi:primosomal protein N' [Kangiella sp. HZ709]|uniref:primosomal protein N' n=1 Tax=Kangiella sp. HZ709 TaxID=2666328 RepID=UPI0012AF53A2|nr:primosomal protein N' [Kangiella sp. HZ709]MRX28269.1 primosomal protein N' [Kangiella sp. HZ709]